MGGMWGCLSKSMLAGGNFPAPGLEPGSCAALPHVSHHDTILCHIRRIVGKLSMHTRIRHNATHKASFVRVVLDHLDIGRPAGRDGVELFVGQRC